MARLQAIVYHNWGRWVADCPVEHCGNAERFGKDPRSGVVGGLSRGRFECQEEYGGCGSVCEAVWPEERQEIEHILAQRPVPANRNWFPGESLTELAVEGAIHDALDGTADIR